MVLNTAGESDQQSDVAAIKASIFDRLTAELNRGDDIDIRAIGKEVASLQKIGGKSVEILKRPEGAAILKLMEALHPPRQCETVSSPEAPFGGWEAVVVGMSSMGPSVCAMFAPHCDHQHKLKSEQQDSNVSYAPTADSSEPASL
jgi:hypothetical protein